jgi:hypothetical protein
MGGGIGIEFVEVSHPHRQKGIGKQLYGFSFSGIGKYGLDILFDRSLLQQLGVSLPHELQYLDDAQLGSVVALLKPVAAKAFVRMMAHV